MDSKDEATKDSTDTMVVPPMIAKDAPSEPSMGEPASASQPQPVYPDTAASDMVEAEAADKMIDETNDEPSSSQPQPVYPDGM